MKITSTILATSAVALIVGSANAATVAPDTFIGADTQGSVTLPSSGEGSEESALEAILGGETEVSLFAKYSSSGDDGDGPYFDLSFSEGVWSFELPDGADTPEYFALKLGKNLGDKIPNDVDTELYFTHYFFKNDGGAGDSLQLSTLAWANAFTTPSTTGSFSLVAYAAAAEAEFNSYMWEWFLDVGGDGDKLSHISLFNASTTTVVPLPAAGWLLLGGLGGLAALRRRKTA